MHALYVLLCIIASLVKCRYRITLVAPCKPFMFGISVTEQLLISYRGVRLLNLVY